MPYFIKSERVHNTFVR
ncbi:hypothetical protein ABWV16_24910 [Bacillus velezensis]